MRHRLSLHRTKRKHPWSRLELGLVPRCGGQVRSLNGRGRCIGVFDFETKHQRLRSSFFKPAYMLIYQIDFHTVSAWVRGGSKLNLKCDGLSGRNSARQHWVPMKLINDLTVLIQDSDPGHHHARSHCLAAEPERVAGISDDDWNCQSCSRLNPLGK